MPSIKKISFALMMSAMTAGSAVAADAIGYPTSVSPEPVPVYDNAGFDWTGFYAGVYGTAQDYNNNWEYGLGVDLGANYQFDFFLLGGEVAFSGLGNGTTGRGYGQALARGGVVVTDEMLIYAAGGYGGDFSSGDRHWLAGGGLEYAVTDNISLRGQYLHGFAANAGATDTNQITFGANFHF
jgi:outer membrane immunogenic protein